MKSWVSVISLAGATCLALIQGGCNGDSRESGRRAPIVADVITPASHAELDQIFDRRHYTWDNLTQGVPAIILTRLPDDLKQIPEVNERKRIFFLSLLPMVLIANDQIARQRDDLLEYLRLYDQEQPLRDSEVGWITQLSQQYRVKGDPLSDPSVRRLLLERIDVIPPSLVLAQAANESGYGTSRFARNGNNLFGQYTFTPGAGMVPYDRPDGAAHELRSFGTLFDSVRSYMNNINTHAAYQDLRKQRATLRAKGLSLKGLELAKGLTNYSERGEDYIHDIRAIIRANRLSLLSSISLRRPGEQETATEPTRPISPMGQLLETRAD